MTRPTFWGLDWEREHPRAAFVIYSIAVVLAVVAAIFDPLGLAK